MNRRNIFIIGLISAVITIICLNVFVGRSYGRYGDRRHHHHYCDRNNSDKYYHNEKKVAPRDSTNNY